MQQGDYFDLATADAISNEEGSGNNYEFTSSWNPAGTPRFRKLFQLLDGGENAI